MTEAQQEAIEECLNKIDDIVRHLKNVRENGLIVGKKMIEVGELEEGCAVIANTQNHDNSKFRGVEFLFLNGESAKTKLEMAACHHAKTNAHHPEYWCGIQNMPRVYIAEMVCDWAARASEFGTSLREWVEDGAAKRYGYKKADKVYREIIEFVDMLCEKPFKQK